MQDSYGAVLLLRALARRLPLRHVLPERVHRGPKLLAASACGPWTVDIVERPQGVEGFRPLPRRWVEQSFAGFGRNRGLVEA